MSKTVSQGLESIRVEKPQYFCSWIVNRRGGNGNDQPRRWAGQERHQTPSWSRVQLKYRENKKGKGIRCLESSWNHTDSWLVTPCFSNVSANVTMNYKVSWKMQRESLRKHEGQVFMTHECRSIEMSLTSAPFSRSNSTQSASDTMQAQCRGFSVPCVQFTSAPCGEEFRRHRTH